MSISGLARLCGVGQPRVSAILEKAFIGNPSVESLQASQGKDFKLKITGFKNCAFIETSVCLDVIRYYYSVGKCTALGCKLIGMPSLDGQSPQKQSKSRPRTLAGQEKKIQRRMKKELGGEMEVSTEAGNIDLLTSTQIIEIKEIKSWKSGLGQILVYGSYYPSHQMRLHLFGSCHESYLAVPQKHCDRLEVLLTSET